MTVRMILHAKVGLKFSRDIFIIQPIKILSMTVVMLHVPDKNKPINLLKDHPEIIQYWINLSHEWHDGHTRRKNG
jgi:hypothetical protein